MVLRLACHFRLGSFRLTNNHRFQDLCILVVVVVRVVLTLPQWLVAFLLLLCEAVVLASQKDQKTLAQQELMEQVCLK